MEVLKIKSGDLIEKIERFLKEGKVLVFPTDTVYGILADATNEKALKKILKIKKRKFGKAIPIFVSDLKLAKKIAEISAKEEKFLKKIWPGKVTVILKRKNVLPGVLFSKEKTIGLRIPKYPLLNKILKRTKLPLTGTSANISGFPASTKLKEVLSQFKNKEFQPDVIVDAGNLKPSKPSTVVDISKKKFFLIREGQMPKEKLKKIYLSL